MQKGKLQTASPPQAMKTNLPLNLTVPTQCFELEALTMYFNQFFNNCYSNFLPLSKIGILSISKPI